MQKLLGVLLLVQLPLAVAQAVIEHTIDPYFYGACSVFAADVDGDGDNDVLGAAEQAGDITWWENVDGSGTEWIEHTIDGDFNTAEAVFATDMDGDGDIDVLGAARAFSNLIWWENTDGTGLSWTEHFVDENFHGAVCVYAADVDGDGDTDVISTSRLDDTIAWWENVDGTGIAWVEHLIDDLFWHANSPFAADVDGDGDIDILGASGLLDEINWWENADGTGTSLIEHTVTHIYDGAFIVYATDMDGDGDTDVLGGALDADNITWWENNTGQGTVWTEHLVGEVIQGPHSIVATDVDGDGDTDVLSAAVSGNGEIAWWENTDGVGTAWVKSTIDDDFDHAVSVHAADIDGDGLVDVLGAAEEDNDIAWWKLVLTVDLQAPNGGEAWRAEIPHEIEWVSDLNQDVRIELLQDGQLVDVLTDSTANDGLFEWVPSGDLPPGNGYRIRVVTLDGAVEDISSATFSILNPPSVVTTPVNPPIEIPRDGYGFWYWVVIDNPTNNTGSGQAWTEVILPNGNTYGPLLNFSVSLGPSETFEPDMPFSQWVPGYAPAGSYQHVMHIGLFPDLILDSDSFEFEKLAMGTGTSTPPREEWSFVDWPAGPPGEGDPGSAGGSNQKHVPANFQLHDPHPNPFNSSANVVVDLSEATELSLVVFNAMGKQVMSLASGTYPAGKHTFLIDGSEWASGLYFVNAKVTGELDQVRKVMLVR